MRIFQTTRPLLSLFAIAGLVASCSGKPQKPDEPEAKEQPSAEEPSSPEVERSIPPLEPLSLADEAPEATELGSVGDTTSYAIGDLKVIHKRTEANPVVQARVYVRGGSTDLTERTSGIEKLAMRVAVTGGTESTPKDTYNAALDSTGASVFSFADRSYSGYGLKTLVDHFDANWELFEQAVLEPAMPGEEVSVRRAKHLAEIASMFENPDSHLSYVAGQKMFEGHPYANLQIGTKENVESFTRDELLAFQRHLLVPAKMLVVVVGDLDSEQLLQKIGESFGRLQPRETDEISFPPFASEPGVVFEQRELPTNYVLGYFSAPAPGDADYPAMLVAMDFLRERLFEEVRTKRNLTYAVSSGISDQSTNYGYLYTTAVDVPTTLGVIFDEVARLKANPITDEQLEQTKSVFITKYFKNLQPTGSQASQLAQAELIGGDWRQASTRLEKIRAVTPADIQRVADDYLNDYRFAVVGPRDDFAPELFQGEATDDE